MAPLPSNNTNTYFLDYTSNKVRHTLEFRLQGNPAPIDEIGAATALANALAVFMHESDSFLGLRRRLANSNLSFPMAWTPISGSNTAPVPQQDKPDFISFTGRSGGGRRVRVTFFGNLIESPKGYRAPRSADGNLSAVLSVLEDSFHGFCAIDGQRPIWNQYINFGENAYWQRQARRAGG